LSKSLPVRHPLANSIFMITVNDSIQEPIDNPLCRWQ
jgi:hypothetical protein